MLVGQIAGAGRQVCWSVIQLGQNGRFNQTAGVGDGYMCVD